MSAIDIPGEIRPVDQQLVERFRRDLGVIWKGDGTLGIAVSGGPDSVALLLLAHGAMPGRIEAASLDHGLRLESAEECAFVARLCAKLAIPHEIFAVEVSTGNIQAKAREARYQALSRWGIRRGLDALATAHHADDQAETFLMRLNRGSGLPGLLGVRASALVPATDFPVVRPLLAWRKRELSDLVASTGLLPVADPSNADMSFDRVKMRAALEANDWLDPVAIAKSSSLLAEAQTLIDVAIGSTWDTMVGENEGLFWYYPGVNRFENIEVVAMIIGKMGGEPRRSDVARMVDRLVNDQTASLAGLLARPVIDKHGPGDREQRWDFTQEPPRKTG